MNHEALAALWAGGTIFGAVRCERFDCDGSVRGIYCCEKCLMNKCIMNVSISARATADAQALPI